MNEIEIIYQDIEIVSWEDGLENFVNLILKDLEISNWELSITLCGNKFIQNINNEYRDKDTPTDVITFVMSDEPFPEIIDPNGLYSAGDIIISLEYVKENSSYFNVPYEEELKRVLIHGILHLKGLDHKTNEPSEEMIIIQENILQKLDTIGLL